MSMLYVFLAINWCLPNFIPSFHIFCNSYRRQNDPFSHYYIKKLLPFLAWTNKNTLPISSQIQSHCNTQVSISLICNNGNRHPWSFIPFICPNKI